MRSNAWFFWQNVIDIFKGRLIHMLKKHYAITTDVARVYKVRELGRYGFGWAVATIREWPRGGSIDVQSDCGKYAYTWNAIGDEPLRKFLLDLHFDYFMGKAATWPYRVFDVDATVRGIKGDIFERVEWGTIDRATAHEWRDDVDECADTMSEHLFAERLMQNDWFFKVFDVYPSIVMRPSGQALSFWNGPWKALCSCWRAELKMQSSMTKVMV